MTEGPNGRQSPHEAYRRGLDPWRWLAALSAISLFALMLLITADVIGRYFLNAPITGALEIADMLMCAIIFAVLPRVCRREGHITVDLLDHVLPSRLARIRDVLVNLIGTAFMLLVAWRMGTYGMQLASYGDRTLFLNIPLYPANLFISVMAALSAVVLVINAWTVARR